MKWIRVKDSLPEMWERVAVLEFESSEPIISHVTFAEYFDAQGKTFTKTIWYGARKEVLFWTKLPPLPAPFNI